MSAVSAAIEPPPAAPPERPPWRPWTAPAALVVAVVTALVLGSIVYVIAAIATGHARSSPGANIVATVLGDAAFVGSAVFFAQLSARPTAAQFGLRRTSLLPAIGWMALGYPVFLLFADVWLHLLGVSQKDHTLDDLGRSTIALASAAILVSVIAPMAEELLFRGYIFTALRGWAGVWGSAAITGILFGIIHLDPDRPVAFLLPLAVFGFVLCLVYWKTRSLYPCIALHSINNALAFGVTEGWTWQIPLLAAGALGVIGLVLLQVRRLPAWPAAPA
jgi:uncharacterized protein